MHWARTAALCIMAPPRPGLSGTLMAPVRKRDFAGNKAFLPSKPCAVCGRAMTWRKAWAKTWEDVRYCSERCRRNKGAAVVATPARDG